MTFQKRKSALSGPVSGILAFSVLLWFGLGCRGDIDMGETSLVLSVAISPTPPPVGQSRLIISLADSAGAPVEGAFIVVEGNMSHAGMVPVVDTALAEEPGRYGISDFSFTMAGDRSGVRLVQLRQQAQDGRLPAA